MKAEPTSGEKFEKVAFQFCKIATVALICGRYTLPVAATLATVAWIVTVNPDVLKAIGLGK